MANQIDSFWQVFLPCLSANAVTLLVVYALVLKHRGTSLGEIAMRSAALSWKIVSGFIKAYVVLIVWGAIVYGFYIIATRGIH